MSYVPRGKSLIFINFLSYKRKLIKFRLKTSGTNNTCKPVRGKSLQPSSRSYFTRAQRLKTCCNIPTLESHLEARPSPSIYPQKIDQSSFRSNADGTLWSYLTWHTASKRSQPESRTLSVLETRGALKALPGWWVSPT